ncbi:MAG: fumarylacetoacetate hydrolase family protein [Anaerolineaceae bacterium]|nr:fumarylacetoacetate hydrolase family protein [Anaerolineaceae bacterium]MBN2677631.1 fumarylacetoacetate hydrolase family protein [Anaerolineaceae bacterium]
MRVTRFTDQNNPPTWGWISAEKIGPLNGDPYGAFSRIKPTIPLYDVTLLPPVIPGKIIGIGRNYSEHARERGVEVPVMPMFFIKAPTTVIATGEAIVLPPQSQRVEHEAELAIVIGKKGRWIDPAAASQHILGYTVANDVTARDLQEFDSQWGRAKGFDTFCPLGPWIDTDFDPSDAMISCRVNGELRQMSSTHEMIFPVGHLVAYLSSIMTLLPGDVILTGTPAGTGPLQAGDILETSVEGLGTIRNPVSMQANQT